MRVFIRYAGKFSEKVFWRNFRNFCCCFQESETGLYVSLTTFFGFGKDFVERYYQKTNHAAFLHIQRTKIEVRIANSAFRG